MAHVTDFGHPQSGGRATRVQNGHVFAVLALHELSLHRPGRGYDQLARAGATTIAAYAACFRQKRLPPLYALGLPGMPDYLPNRAMRQMFQLYEMTGAERFLHYGEVSHAKPDVAGQVWKRGAPKRTPCYPTRPTGRKTGLRER